MDPKFEIPCRSFRIGSLIAKPSKLLNRIKFTKKGFRLRVDLDDPKKEHVRLFIPAESITRIEGNLGRGCPVLWIGTSTTCASKLRKQCGMKKDVYPTPYFDPKSEELSESRICVIPLHDPICEQQLAEFKGVLSVMATMRRTTVRAIFQETVKKVCHEQLVHCTKYISEISGLQTAWKLKRQSVPVDRSEYDVIFRENENDAAIVISSDNDSDVTLDSNDNSLSIDVALESSPVQTKSPTPRKNGGLSISKVASLKRSASTELDSAPVKSGKITTDSIELKSEPIFDDLPEPDEPRIRQQTPKSKPVLGKEKGTKKSPEIADDVSDNDKADATYVKTSTSMQADMRTLFDDTGTMSDVSPLCICVMKSRFAINFAQHKVTCMALDNVDGKLSGCPNPVSESFMMRASKNLPAIAMCSEHKTRMVAHECCPCCGTFCTGGTFLICSATKDRQHRFHRHCLAVTQHSRDCPHCGASMTEVHVVTLEPTPRYLKKFDCENVGDRSADKKKRDQYPDCVVKMPGVTLPLPENLRVAADSPFRLKRSSVDMMLGCLGEDIPKKGRLQSKNLFSLVKQGDVVKALQLICFGGVNPNYRPPGAKDMRTCLHEAVARENIPMIHLLITAGADVNLRDQQGKSPIFYAEEQNNLDVMKYLICSGSDLLQGDTDGMRPLHHSAKEGRLKTCLLLLKFGRRAINTTDDGGWTSLVWSAEHERIDIARCLDYYDADVQTVDNDGNICLQWAALAGNSEILLMCLRRNSDVDHQNSVGDTALHIAARQNNRQCVVTLLAWGANPLIRNSDNQTPSDCAKDSSLCQVNLLTNMMTRCAVADHRGFEPLDRERLLCKDISRGKENIPIPCVNAVDEAPCPVSTPHEFLYISKNINKHSTINAVKDIMTSCQCARACTSCKCGPCWYDASGCLLPSFDYRDPPSIVECNNFCKCPKSCMNRVAQTGGVRCRIQLFRTTNIGWGVRALETIPVGSFVCEYVGEIVSGADPRDGDSYLFDLSENPDDNRYIDAAKYGNVSRFLNHHCEPNLVPVRFFYDHQDANFPRIGFFAQRAIRPDEQLCFDYGPQFWTVKCETFYCECGSDVCRYSEKVLNSTGDDEFNNGSDVTPEDSM